MPRLILVLTLLFVLHPDTYSAVKADSLNDTLLSEQFLPQKTEQAAPANSRTSVTTSIKVPFKKKVRGFIGIFFIVAMSMLLSNDRKNIQIRIIVFGLLMQILLAVLILHVPFIEGFFTLIGNIFIKVLEATEAGSKFLFGNLVDLDRTGYVFAFQVLPTVIFFSALMSLLFYLGVIQFVVYGMAWGLSKILKMSGHESLAVAGNIFLGQTESPLLIKAYLPKLTNSELFTVMVSGLATIAGGVMAAYIGMLGGNDPVERLNFARHLVTASVMAAPGSVVIAKIIFPQTDEYDHYIEIPKHHVGKNILDSISNGAYEGLKLAANIAIMLLVFYAFIALFNAILLKLGSITHLNSWITNVSNGQYHSLSIEFLLGMIFSPIMWVLGVPLEDLSNLGRLMGEKLVFTEFVGYSNLSKLVASGGIQSPRSILIATYMLCGFANFASVGILVGGLGSLAPNKKEFISKYGMRAMIAGTFASMLSAAVVGIIV